MPVFNGMLQVKRLPYLIMIVWKLRSGCHRRQISQHLVAHWLFENMCRHPADCLGTPLPKGHFTIISQCRPTDSTTGECGNVGIDPEEVVQEAQAREHVQAQAQVAKAQANKHVSSVQTHHPPKLSDHAQGKAQGWCCKRGEKVIAKKLSQIHQKPKAEGQIFFGSMPTQRMQQGAAFSTMEPCDC